MKIIDWYILKRYLGTFFVMLILFIPIAIVIDVTEKINKILRSGVSFDVVALYYFNFTIYFANILFPIFLFLSVVWFTSKLANNTEIVAILSSGISYWRFLRPYFVGSIIVSLIALVMGMFIVPKASAAYNDFTYKYLKSTENRQSVDVYRRISPDEIIFVSSFNFEEKTGYNFNYEKFKEGTNELEYKIYATRIVYDDSLKSYFLYNFQKRTIGEVDDQIEQLSKTEMKFNFDIDELSPVVYAAETMQLGELKEFIKKEEMRGSSNLDAYRLVLYKRYSVPVSVFILTIIAVSISSRKRRGGLGVNLAVGMGIGFSYVFFDKIFGVLASASSVSPLLAVVIPNLMFGILSVYLIFNAKR